MFVIELSFKSSIVIEFFQTSKGRRHEDPLSPLLFNLVVDVLTSMLQKVARDDLVRVLGTELTEGGVISLQYTDDTILFMDNDIKCARNLK
jgi:hypothetical protein